MSEAQVQAAILRECGALPGVRLFRNSVGEGWTGHVIEHSRDTLVLAHPRRVTFGWCSGSSDLLGWQSVPVLPAMVGQQVARLVAFEVKHRGTASDEQRRFLQAVERAGGLGAVVRSPADVLAALDGRVLV